MVLAFLLPALLLGFMIYQYHSALIQTFDDYDEIKKWHVVEYHLMEIQSAFLQADKEKEYFISSIDTRSIEKVLQHAEYALGMANNLSHLEGWPKVTQKIVGMIHAYQKKFKAFVQAWKRKGLDLNAGLHGKLQKIAQNLQSQANNYKTDGLLLTLLQMRREEKNLILRREASYLNHVQTRIAEFKNQVRAKKMGENIQTTLLQTVDAYQDAFLTYAQTVLNGGNPLDGEGLFKDHARKLERELQSYFVPNLEKGILALRRGEKKDWLHSEGPWTERLHAEVLALASSITLSSLAETNKSALLALLHSYEKTFLALVEQTDQIDKLSRHPHVVRPLQKFLAENILQVVQKKEHMVVTAQAKIKQRMTPSLVLGAGSLLLVLVLAFFISRQLLDPVRSMEETLENFTTPLLVQEKSGDELKFLSNTMERMVTHLKTIFFQLASQGEELSAKSVDLMFLSKELHDTLQELSGLGLASNRAIQIAEKIYTSLEQVRTLSKHMEERVMALSGISGGMEISLGHH